MNNSYSNIFLAEENALPKYNERTIKAFCDKFGILAVNDGIAYVPVCGAIGTGFWDLCGTDYQTIASDINSACDRDDVKAIVLVMDTPGGSVTGCFDACSFIKNCSKPVYTYVYGMACSAGYALASSTSKIYMAEDSITGCCGAYARCGEVTEEKKKEMGFIERIFRSKNAPKKNLSPVSNEEASREMQMEIDSLGDKYLSIVSANRGVDLETAEETFGKGATVNAEYAIKNNMADKICSIEDAINDIKSSFAREDEGEDMDVLKMSAEEQSALFSQLCEINPSFIEERVSAKKEAEAKRIEALNALRDGSDEVNAVVDGAVASGAMANDIMADVITAMKQSKENAVAKAREEAISALAQATTTVIPPQKKSEEEELDAFFGKENK